MDAPVCLSTALDPGFLASDVSLAERRVCRFYFDQPFMPARIHMVDAREADSPAAATIGSDRIPLPGDGLRALLGCRPNHAGTRAGESDGALSDLRHARRSPGAAFQLAHCRSSFNCYSPQDIPAVPSHSAF